MMNRLYLGFLMFCFLFVLSSKQADAQCASNETEIIISITTDNYPTETSWQLVDQNGGGWYISAGDLTLTNTTYTWNICVPISNCYSFTIFDVYADGICCSWGSGSYNVTYAGITVASGGSFGSSETTSNIGNCSAAPPCSAGEISVTLNMYDSFGDGWNGNTWTASSTTNSSISYGSFTLSSGSSGSTTFCMSEDCYAIVCDYGSWQSEVSWQLVNNATGGIIASGGAPYSQSQIAVGSGSCSSPPPSSSAFCDDFESYINGSWLAASSSDWTTWTQPYTANEDVQITNSLSNSPSNSIYFNGTSSPGGPSDVVLPFGSTAPYTSGYFNFSAEFYVINGAYFNFQSEVATNIGWAFEAEMTTAGVINFTYWNGTSSSPLLSVNYPSNQWFELKMEIDINLNIWAVFIDGVLQGSFANPNNKIASLDLYPISGNQFYVDDVCYEYSITPISTYGCTDPIALNYNAAATIDDGSCIYTAGCGLDSTEMIVTLTTDDFPLETSWQLVDQNGGGWYISPGDLTIPNYTYTWNICVPDSNCYQFTISDTYGDGLCGSCWGGTDGYYNVTYGGTTVASSTAANFGSSETTFNLGACSFPPSSCPNNDIEVIITINTDDYPTETSWFLIDQYGGGWTNVPLTSSFANTTLVWTLCVPDTNCYTFTMLDSYGDGICCAWGLGSYNISYDGIVVGSGGSFTFTQEHCGIGMCTPNCQIVIPPTAITEGEPCGTDANHGCDDSWKISNFTIQGVTDDWSWGYLEVLGVPVGEGNPDLYVLMRKNNNFFYYSDYYLNTWYPNSFSMYAGISSPPLEIPTQGLFTSPYVQGQTFSYEFDVWDDDYGTPVTFYGNNDYIGSYTLPNSLTSGVNSITTSGGSDGNAYVDYTLVAPVNNYTPLTNNNIVHGNFWAENNIRDTDWYSFSLSDSSTFTVNAISETPFNVMLLDATNGCGGAIVIDSVFSLGCDTINIQQSLPAGDYWVLAFPTTYSCMSCSDSVDYLLDIAWTDVCDLEVIAFATDADCSGDNAQINLTINGGTAPFNYSWNNGDSTQDLQNIPIGIYDVLVTDDKGCIDTVSNIVVNSGVLIHDFYVADYVMAFEPTQDFSGWLIDDANNDGYSWSVNQYTGVNSSYGAIYNYNTNGITAADDWLFSQCFVLDSAENYYLSFLSRVASASFPEDMSVFIGSAQEPTFMSIQLMQLNNMTNVIYDSLGVLFTVPSSGIYYLGWHAESNANSWRIDLDNINLGLFVQQFGCTDSLAINYDPQATVDDSSCIYPFYGCTDSTALNYNPLANIDDGSCIATIYGCTDSTAINYYAGASIDDGSCMYNLFGCTDSLAINYDSTVLIDDGSCIYPFYGCSDSTALNYNPLANIDDGSCVYCIDGCTDTIACNYDTTATCDDGSCILPNGCTDTIACNYDAAATCDDGSCMLPDGCTDSTALNYDSAATCDDGSCMYFVYGCMDSIAINYNPLATIDDSSCIYPFYGCTDSTALNYNPLANIDDGSCVATIYGCTDSTALNYYAGANIDDSTCLYAIYGCTDPCNSCNYNPLANMDDGSCVYSTACMATGCIDPLALNYDPTACYDDSSCVYCVYGCMDSMALNYDSLATCDNGSCTFVTCGAITGVNLTDVIQDRAIFNWDNMNSASCQVDQIRFRYREVGTNSWSTKTMGVPVGSGCNTSNTSKLVLGLTPSTTYEYDFKIWYCNASTVNWHANGTFTTADVCVNATNMTATPNSTTQTDFCWDAPSSPWAFVRLQYRENVPGSSFSNIGGFGVMSPDLCKIKNGLTPGLQYRVMWRTWCNVTGGPYRSPVWDGPVIWDQPLVRLEGGTTINNLDVYPNPSRDVFNVTFISETIQDLKVRILNVVGEELISDNLEQFIGEYSKQIDLSDNAKGIYFLEITTNNGLINKKLILQ